MQNLKKKSQQWLEAHSPLYALLLVALSMLLVALGATVLEVLGSFVVMAWRGDLSSDGFNKLGITATLLSLLAYVLILLLYWRKFRAQLQGFFGLRQSGAGILLGWSELAIGAFTLLAGILSHKAYGNIGTALILGLQPGISEEIMCRIIPISIAMRSRKREELLLPVIAFSSIIFGLGHCINIFSGADPLTTLFQVLYSCGTGFLFAAIYARTGNIWSIIILHSLTDTIYFLGAEAQSGSGVLAQGTTAADAVFMLIYAALYFVNAFYIFRKSKRAGIPQIWAGIWKNRQDS